MTAIELEVLDYLRENLETPSYLEVPEEPDPEYIIVEKLGSGRENYIERATLAIQSYADSMVRACEINEAVKRKMNILAYDYSRDISRSALNSDYNFTDIDSRKYRYQAVYDIYY